MSRTHKDKVQYTIASLFREIRKLNGRDDCYTAWDTYADYVDQWWVRGRMNRSGNKRKLMARLKVQERRRARRELEREVLDPFIYTRKSSGLEYDHACRNEDTQEWSNWYWYKEDVDFNSTFPEDYFGFWPRMAWHDDDDDMEKYLYPEDAFDYHDGFTPMIDEEGYAYYWDHTPSHSNAKPHDFSRGVSLGELLMSKLR